MAKSSTFKIVVLLALLQGVAGLLRGFNWVQLGGDLFRQGLLLLPMIGAVAIMRGMFILAVALFYLLFVVGALLGRSWAWGTGLTAATINLLIVVGALIRGAPIPEAIAWSAIPIILLIYIFSEMGREPLHGS